MQVKLSLEPVEQDAGVDAGAAGEIALGTGGVEEPVGLDYETEFWGEGHFHAEEGSNCHERIFVHGCLLLGDEVSCAALGYDVVLDAASAYDAACEGVDAAFAAVDVIQEYAAPSGMGVGWRRGVFYIGTVALRSYAEHVGGGAESEFDVATDAEGASLYLHGSKGLSVGGQQFEPVALDVSAVEHHSTDVASETEVVELAVSPVGGLESGRSKYQ